MTARALSLRARLLLLVVAGIVPLLAVMLGSQYLAYRAAIARTSDEALARARGMAFGVEQELAKYIAVLDAIAGSTRVRERDLDIVRRRLDTLIATQLPGANFILLQADGQHLLNTAVSADADQGRRRDLDSLRRALESGGAVVSDLREGTVQRRLLISIDMPVKPLDGGAPLILSVTPPADAFVEIIRRQDLPAGWAASVFDRQARVVARVPNGETFVGSRASPSFLPHLLARPEGVIEATTLEGVEVFTAFSRDQRFGWAVGIGVPRTEVTGPATAAAWSTLGVAGALLAIGLALALAVARQISQPIATLRLLAAGGADLVQAPTSTGLAEADEVVTALRAAELRRRASEQSFRYLFENSPLPKWVYDPETLRFLAVNEAAVEAYGYSREEFLGMTLRDIRPTEDVAAMEQVVRTAAVRQRSGEWRHRRKDGKLVDMEIFSHALGFEGRPARVAVMVDVTARKAAEAQLLHAQKMEAVGQLTGGLAHDFNNLLGVILGNLALLADSGPDDPEAPSFVEEAHRAAQRGADLTRSLLAFARRQPLRPARLDPNQLIEETVALLRRTLGERIAVTLALGESVWPVRVDRSQLEAALINLGTNARDAMPRGGRLAIATRNGRLDEDYAAGHAEVLPGDYVVIEVSDDGIGIPPELVDRIFEPFFTTKGRGEGTGLGLSMVFGFIKQSGGHVAVYSEPGVGTTFRLYLPRLHDLAEAPGADAVTTPRGESETVLVVEDDPALRRVVVRQLTQLGYRVEAADSAAAALERLERGPVDLLFSDVVMAGKLDGFDLCRAVAARWPQIRILLTSGFPGTAGPTGDGPPVPGVSLLGKPFQKADLARAVRAALQAERTAS